MKKIMFFVAATFALAAIGCSKDDVAADDVQYVSEITLNLEGDSRVSTEHSTDGLKFAWENGDVIYVWEDKNESAISKLFTYDATSDSFKANGVGDEGKLEIGKKYFATTQGSSLYKISIGTDGNSKIDQELKNGVGISMNSMITDVFEATTENTMATMHHIVGVVEIPVKAAVAGKKLQQLGLNSQTANQSIRGIFYISPMAPYVVDDEYGYFDTYNQTNSDTPIDLSTTESTSIFVPAYPGTYSTIDVKYTLVGDTEQTIKTNHQLVVERGKITKISEFVLE